MKLNEALDLAKEYMQGLYDQHADKVPDEPFDSNKANELIADFFADYDKRVPEYLDKLMKQMNSQADRDIFQPQSVIIGREMNDRFIRLVKGY